MIGTNTDERHCFGSPKPRSASVLISGVLVAIFITTICCRISASEQERSQWQSSAELTDGQTVTVSGVSESEIVDSAVSDSEVDGHPEEVLPSRRVRKNVRTVTQAAFSADSHAETETVLRPVKDQNRSVVSSNTLQTIDAGQPPKAFIDLSGPAEPIASVTSPSAVTASTMDQVRLGAWMLILVCGVVLAVLAMRRWKRNQGLLPATGKTSRVVETLSLGPGRSVSLIEIAGMRALVGADAGGIRTIVMAPRTFDDEIHDNEFEDFPARETLSERTTALHR